MRILELQLFAFGPFTDAALTFPEDVGLHLIYGPNEAGKSTALRAITGLLYGIPAATGDAHVHRMNELRVGARLASGRRRLTVVRRKGNKNTLLDEAGAALPDDALAEFLNGIDESTFRAMFGLDHESLRRGAEALLRGRGNIGESLFDAGVGGRGIQVVLEDLTREADALYRPRGQTQKINEAMRELRQAQKRRGESELSAEAWQAQIDAIESDREELRAIAEERRRLAVEANALERARRVLPQIAKLHELRERRAALGVVRQLAPDARERRLEAQRCVEECERQLERLHAELVRHTEDRQRIAVSQALAELSESVVEELQNRLGEQRKAAVDLPKRLGELEALRADVTALTRRLGADAGGGRESRGLQPAVQARIRTLANERSGVRAALELGRHHLAEQERKMEQLREALRSNPPVSDPRALQRALGAAVQVADLPVQVEKMRRRWEREREDVMRAAAGLGLAPREIGDLQALALPSPEAVDRVSARVDALERYLEEARARQREVAGRARKNDRDRSALELMGAVPSEEALAEGRKRRDELWRGFWHRGGVPSEDERRDYESTVRAADDLADRLRREAERVAQRAALLADRDVLLAEGEAVRREIEEISGKLASTVDEWRALWAGLGVEAAGAAQMRGWLHRAQELRQQAARTDELREQVEEAAATLAARYGALRCEVEALGGAPSEDFAALVDTAAALVENAAELARRREEEDRTLSNLQEEVALSRRRVATSEKQLAEWEDAWGESVSALGLSGAATPEEVQAVLEHLSTLYARRDEMTRMEQRVAGLQEDAERFSIDVQRYVEFYAPGLLGRSSLEMAEQLLRLQKEAVADLREWRRLGLAIDELRRAIGEQEGRLAQARHEIDTLLADAGVQDVAALGEYESRSGLATDLESRLADVEEQLLEAGEGASLEELIEQVGGVDADAASARLSEVNGLLDHLAERQSTLDNQIGRNQNGLEYMQRERGAADAAAEVEEKLAEIATHTQRYVRLRLAIAIVEEEIERYRRDNQGPVLSRASELFPRLTLGRYRALRIGYGSRDEAVLRCVRRDGTEVDVEALSDGTRDQLYLALRLATLEQYAQTSAPMPLVLDDVLIHFDDDRARAAFEVLGEFAETTQVLFFTHHARLRDLAFDGVPSLCLHKCNVDSQ